FHAQSSCNTPPSNIVNCPGKIYQTYANSGRWNCFGIRRRGLPRVLGKVREALSGEMEQIGRHWEDLCRPIEIDNRRRPSTRLPDKWPASTPRPSRSALWSIIRSGTWTLGMVESGEDQSPRWLFEGKRTRVRASSDQPTPPPGALLSPQLRATMKRPPPPYSSQVRAPAAGKKRAGNAAHAEEGSEASGRSAASTGSSFPEEGAFWARKHGENRTKTKQRRVGAFMFQVTSSPSSLMKSNFSNFWKRILTLCIEYRVCLRDWPRHLIAPGSPAFDIGRLDLSFVSDLYDAWCEVAGRGYRSTFFRFLGHRLHGRSARQWEWGTSGRMCLWSVSVTVDLWFGTLGTGGELRRMEGEAVPPLERARIRVAVADEFVDQVQSGLNPTPLPGVANATRSIGAIRAAHRRPPRPSEAARAPVPEFVQGSSGRSAAAPNAAESLGIALAELNRPPPSRPAKPLHLVHLTSRSDDYWRSGSVEHARLQRRNGLGELLLEDRRDRCHRMLLLLRVLMAKAVGGRCRGLAIAVPILVGRIRLCAPVALALVPMDALDALVALARGLAPMLASRRSESRSRRRRSRSRSPLSPLPAAVLAPSPPTAIQMIRLVIVTLGPVTITDWTCRVCWRQGLGRGVGCVGFLVLVSIVSSHISSYLSAYSWAGLPILIVPARARGVPGEEEGSRGRGRAPKKPPARGEIIAKSTEFGLCEMCLAWSYFLGEVEGPLGRRRAAGAGGGRQKRRWIKQCTSYLWVTAAWFCICKSTIAVRIIPGDLVYLAWKKRWKKPSLEEEVEEDFLGRRAGRRLHWKQGGKETSLEEEVEEDFLGRRGGRSLAWKKGGKKSSLEEGREEDFLGRRGGRSLPWKKGGKKTSLEGEVEEAWLGRRAGRRVPWKERWKKPGLEGGRRLPWKKGGKNSSLEGEVEETMEECMEEEKPGRGKQSK
ncbi:hypothetical protein DFP72DRAFT_848861, partial [Ephemerocybe angulata]